MENVEINSANTREMTNNGAISAPEGLKDSNTEPGHEEQEICGETIRDSKS